MPFVAYLKVNFAFRFRYMNFVNFIHLKFFQKKEQVSKKGLSALNSALDFDEFKVLETNSQYLRNTLQV